MLKLITKLLLLTTMYSWDARHGNSQSRKLIPSPRKLLT